VSGTPRPVIIWVKVGSHGRALATQPGPGAAGNRDFVVLARYYAKNARYRPARKDGQPVDAWYQFRFFPRSPQP
jgi:hypothetical protein